MISPSHSHQEDHHFPSFNQSITFSTLSIIMECDIAVTLKNKPNVIGVYGIPGSGKTYLIHALKHRLGKLRFEFYEGISVIDAICPGGLDAFKLLPPLEKQHFRQQFIKKIQQNCLENGKTEIVAGHLVLWAENENPAELVDNECDWEVYTHILYLSPSPNTISQYRLGDETRMRDEVSVQHLERWMAKQGKKPSTRALQGQ
jgi:adenylate kinase